MVGERTVVVIPCFNEADRLDRAEVLALAEGGVGVILVDDGSIDATGRVLAETAAADPTRIKMVTLPSNEGKAEAVRQGLLAAVSRHDGDGGAVDVVGYLDADFATPVDEMLRLIEVRRQSEVEVLLGSRVALAGRAIHRHPVRHYLGRVFATIASSYVLRVPIYDTQCGAKLFVNTGRFRAAIDTPFRSPWAFDVELIGRLLFGTGRGDTVGALPFSAVREEPLECWFDVPGSKISVQAMVTSTVELLAIRRQLTAGRPRVRRRS